ncbi:MAG TPA: nicotinate-nucleotide adenylyltransferase [Candidatus Limnocylindrales bacterium]|nr:nicotinate-nucleotide adenylyltransferase [Candidatus Limnocylindrales bacterium]
MIQPDALAGAVVEGTVGPAVGLLGGTFDPIHNGHLAIAAQVRDALSLTGVTFIPAGVPPHKPGQAVSPGVDRAAMIALAIAHTPGFSLSTIELDRPGLSYTADTLAALASAGRPGSGLEFILSAEAFAGFPGWHEPGRILDLARLAVVPRAGARPIDSAWLDAQLPGWRERVDFVEAPPIDISASVIRDRVRAGLPIDGLVPGAVADYIRTHRLYTDAL